MIGLFILAGQQSASLEVISKGKGNIVRLILKNGFSVP